MATIEGTFDKGRHNGAKGTYVKEILAHEITDFTVQFRIACLHLFDVLFFFNPYIFFGHFDIVANLTLQADIGNQAIPRFRIHTRHITGIGITIGITIFYVKQDGKFIAILNGF